MTRPGRDKTAKPPATPAGPGAATPRHAVFLPASLFDVNRTSDLAGYVHRWRFTDDDEQALVPAAHLAQLRQLSPSAAKLAGELIDRELQRDYPCEKFTRGMFRHVESLVIGNRRKELDSARKWLFRRGGAISHESADRVRSW